MSFTFEETRKMKKFFKHTALLGLKEIKSFLNDKVFLIFVIYVFSVNIVFAAKGASLDLKNASVAYVDEDKSQLSQRYIQALRKPHFKTPVEITFDEIEEKLDKGKNTFAIIIPKNFQADLMSGKETSIQLNIDATAVSQGYIGDAYITQIINQETLRFFNEKNFETKLPVEQVVKVLHNPNLSSEWFMSISELIIVTTMLSMILPAVALIREKEIGTIEHLLVMPLTEVEIIISKIWPNILIILLCAGLSMAVIVQLYFGVTIQGSILSLMLGLIVFLFAIASLGIVLATFSKNIPQIAIIVILVMMPMVFLSGTFTPPESMPGPMEHLMFLSPLKHAIDYIMSLVFRGAGLLDLWKQLSAMLLTGILFFTVALFRFRAWFNSER
ncbi:ABC transporter permease [Pseudomonadota bacterium]